MAWSVRRTSASRGLPTAPPPPPAALLPLPEQAVQDLSPQPHDRRPGHLNRRHHPPCDQPVEGGTAQAHVRGPFRDGQDRLWVLGRGFNEGKNFVSLHGTSVRAGWVWSATSSTLNQGSKSTRTATDSTGCTATVPAGLPMICRSATPVPRPFPGCPCRPPAITYRASCFLRRPDRDSRRGARSDRGTTPFGPWQAGHKPDGRSAGVSRMTASTIRMMACYVALGCPIRRRPWSE